MNRTSCLFMFKSRRWRALSFQSRTELNKLKEKNKQKLQYHIVCFLNVYKQFLMKIQFYSTAEHGSRSILHHPWSMWDALTDALMHMLHILTRRHKCNWNFVYTGVCSHLTAYLWGSLLKYACMHVHICTKTKMTMKA